jgi:hypothetical protein
VRGTTNAYVNPLRRSLNRGTMIAPKPSGTAFPFASELRSIDLSIIQWQLSAAFFALTCSPSHTELANHTELVGWPPNLTASAAAGSREIGTRFGVPPDTFARSPGTLRIVFRDPPFAPVWASSDPQGGTVCHDLGLVMREIALPIAREVYRLSPSSAEVDTISVALSGHTKNGTSGSCSTGAVLRFRPAELIRERGAAAPPRL